MATVKELGEQLSTFRKEASDKDTDIRKMIEARQNEAHEIGAALELLEQKLDSSMIELGERFETIGDPGHNAAVEDRIDRLEATLLKRIEKAHARAGQAFGYAADALELVAPEHGGSSLEAERKIVANCRAEFPPEQIGKLPRKSCKNCTKYDQCNKHSMIWGCPECGGNHTSGTIHLDYIGHAEITARLLAVDPFWNWEPVAWTESGTPLATAKGNDVTMWIRLTVGGVTRLGVGSVARDAYDVEKQLIGDALRNAAMRFGMGLDLWSKSEHLDQTVVVHDDPPKADVLPAGDDLPVAAPAAPPETAPAAPDQAEAETPAETPAEAAPAAVPEQTAPEPAAPPEADAPRATSADGPADHKTLEKVMLDLPPKISIKVKKAFEAEGDLWPMAGIAPERIADALVIIDELQAQNA